MRRRRPSSRRAGFTLVEMMVAMTIGALVIASVYTLGGSAARDFQEQQRVTQLQLSTRLALDRVRRDVERAGLHGTPDSMVERTCVTPARRVRAVQLVNEDGGSRAAINAHQAGAANTTTQADLLRLVGNFATSDAYLVRSFDSSGGTAFLQTSWQGFRRSFAADSTGTTIDPTIFQDVFRAGRMLHIQTVQGNHFFVRVASATVSGNSASVSFTPALGVGGTCVVGLGEGALLAPLSEVEYALQANAEDLPTATSSSGADVTGPNVSLVRRERDMVTNAITETRTVLEWAMHFDVDAIFDDTAVGSAPDARLATLYGDELAETNMAARASRVRALVVTIGARSRDQDPNFPWAAPVPGAPPVRFRVFSDRVGAARVRTATAEIGLPNLIQRGL
ncbi:PilW family protein [Sandaracinus amylolyticus]|uniref:Type IV fimbrial biogenesis protein PilW n=1 Tax=Sandaracinus amylolyticus TaxID=927083 RepID=A0A0F6SDD7_9BACT|nr:prepilin-type N-terminal cleavage/methylation domain-containing protein [Sandaracinus amylolyticus]AKF03264.1 hypothetical protein DB32_000413 [Sandaracinus amylolyticus]